MKRRSVSQCYGMYFPLNENDKTFETCTELNCDGLTQVTFENDGKNNIFKYSDIGTDNVVFTKKSKIKKESVTS